MRQTEAGCSPKSAGCRGGQGVVKIILTRGLGARAMRHPADQACTRIVMAAPLPPHAQPDAPVDVHARWCTLASGAAAPAAGIRPETGWRMCWRVPSGRSGRFGEGLLRDDGGAVIRV